MESNNDGELDIIISNVVATFRTRCHLNLRTIALEGNNVIYKPEQGVRKPPCVDIQRKRIQHLTFFFFFSDGHNETPQAQDNSQYLVFRKNHMHRSIEVSTRTRLWFLIIVLDSS